MGVLNHEIRRGIAWVQFDSGGMNTLSRAAIEELGSLREELERIHARTPLEGVVLTGNRYGLGAGADIGELRSGTRAELEQLIDEGHRQLLAIEEGVLPWLAVVDGFALGGIYELALACRAIVATPRSTVGFPEIRLNLFPGLGGTQRMPRRSGLVNPQDPVAGDAGFTAILRGKNFRAAKALEINMVDALVPEGAAPEAFAESYLSETLLSLERKLPADLSQAESFRPMVLEMINKATLGRPNPRAPYVALEVMIEGAGLELRPALQLERDAFVDVASSQEAKAGMRFFFTQQKVSKPPKQLSAEPLELSRIGIDGIDGYMGNAIAWLALEAGYEVVGHVPVERFAPSVNEKIRAKYARNLERGKLDRAGLEKKLARLTVSTEIACLFDCDLVVEARAEDREIKAAFFRELGKGISQAAVVASNSSSMGPGMLGAEFARGGGDAARFLNLHFFSPAEHPMMQLVEVVRGEATSDEALATVHAFSRRLGKTPVLLADGSPGFLVNAGLAAYFGAAEELYREGTPVATVDAAIRAAVLPMGPFELGDQAGLDVAAGLLDTISRERPEMVPALAEGKDPLVWKLREAGRLGVKAGAGYYDYTDGRKAGEWEGLAAMVPERGERVASDEEIVEHCMRALFSTARSLCERGIAGSEEEADLAFVLGIGFAMHLGGPLQYGKSQGWDA